MARLRAAALVSADMGRAGRMIVLLETQDTSCRPRGLRMLDDDWKASLTASDGARNKRQAGSHRHPSLFTHRMASPSAARPSAP